MTDTEKYTPLESYYALAESWSADRQAGVQRSRTIAWTIAAIAAGIAALEAMALAALAPMKTVEPYTLLVDRTTGFVQLLKGSEGDRITPDDALTQSMLAQYVIAREGFDISSLQANYRKVALWSADTARRSYLATIPASNPSSPLNVYPRTTVVSTAVRSISSIGNGTALVRFMTERLDQGQETGPPAAWVAVISYRFARIPMSIEDRLVNPLGFQVTQYRRDQEAVAAPAVPAPARAIVEPAPVERAPR